MVHRPADSRLLANLQTCEKEYSKQLTALLDASHASLASLSAYAASSPPPVSHLIIAVAGSLAAADDALRRYSTSVDEWRGHLSALKDLEDEVGTIMRDREILVTRLIKASKSQKAPSRDPANHNGSSFSLNAIFPSTPKLTAAHAELQACETHLAQKERDLAARRTGAVRDGLSARCRGAVDCAWVWGEMGKEALAMLDGTHVIPEGGGGIFSKPLPEPIPRPPSDVYSLTPSQSGSQGGSGTTTPLRLSLQYLAPNAHARSDSNNNNHVTKHTLQIPPAHAIPELTLPTSDASPTTEQPTSFEIVPYVPPKQPEISEPIDEEPEDGEEPNRDREPEPEPEQMIVPERPDPDESQQQHHPDESHVDEERPSSSTEEDRPVRLIENVRFANMSPPQSVDSRESGKWYSIRRGGIGEETYPGMKKRDRVRKGSGFLGSLRGLFRGPEGDGGAAGEVEGETRKLSKGGKWKTRTERNLKVLGGGESSGEEGVGMGSGMGSGMGGTPSTPSPSRSTSGGRRLKKERTRRGKPLEEDTERGWTSDGGSPGIKWLGGKKKGEAEEKKRLEGISGNTTKHRRAMSIDGRSSGLLPSMTPPSTPSKDEHYRRKFGTVVLPHPPTGEGNTSLMTIVEDVSRQNREGWAGREGMEKPSPLGRGDLLGMSAQASRSEPVVVGLSFGSGGLEGVNGMNGDATPSRSLKLPLRSALRNASRTPSPLPTPSPPSFPTRLNGTKKGKAKAKPKPDTNGKDENDVDDDVSSESSYETSHEAFDGLEEEETPPLPPPKLDEFGPSGSIHSLEEGQRTPTRNESPSPAGNQPRSSEERSVSTISTETETETPTKPPRRKSVRVSLQPTFSSTPPAIDDDDHVDDEMEGWRSRIPEPVEEEGAGAEMVAWEDSSEEDAEYKKARKLLWRGAKKKKKAKGAK